MRALIQRVKEARVDSDTEELGQIATGLVVFLGVASSDLLKDIDYIVRKVVNIRIFEDESGRFNRSALEINAELLVVSQFTLCAETQKGRRPSFINAAPPEIAENIYKNFCKNLQDENIPVIMGRFGAMMEVGLKNDGPVTILLDSRDRK